MSSIKRVGSSRFASSHIVCTKTCELVLDIFTRVAAASAASFGLVPASFARALTPAAAVAAVSDRMVDAIDVMGDADTVQATMRAYVEAGVDVPVLMPLPWGADRRASANAAIRAGVGKA